MIFLSPFERLVSRRYLSLKRQDGIISLTTIISVLAISVGIWALVMVSSIANGFREQLLDTVLGYHGHVLVQSWSDRKITDYEQLEADILKIDGVAKTLPFVESIGLVTHGDRSRGAVVRGIPDNRFNEGDLGLKQVRAGSLEQALDEGGVIIGYELARELGVGPGDMIAIMPGKTVATPMGSVPRRVSYPVTAIVEIGVFQFDESFIGMPLYDAQVLFQMKGQISTIKVTVDNPDNVEFMEAAFTDAVDQRGHVTHWRRFNAAIVQAMDLERVILFLIVALIIGVASFNIMTSQIMSVKDRIGDIAILRTIGCSTRSVRRIFMGNGITICLIGIVNGLLWSAVWIYFLQEIIDLIQVILGIQVWDPSTRLLSSVEARVEYMEIGAFVLLALVLSWFASLLPAVRAAKTDPVEILRQE